MAAREAIKDCYREVRASAMEVETVVCTMAWMEGFVSSGIGTIPGVVVNAKEEGVICWGRGGLGLRLTHDDLRHCRFGLLCLGTCDCL